MGWNNIPSAYSSNYAFWENPNWNTNNKKPDKADAKKAGEKDKDDLLIEQMLARACMPDFEKYGMFSGLKCESEAFIYNPHKGLDETG